MPSLSERLRDWRAVRAVRPAADDPGAAGGRQAEQFLHTLVSTHLNFGSATLHPNKRVPAGRRKREIDLLIVTPHRVHVIEVKNWSGSLRVVGGRWVQTNRSGREIDHPDLAADHADKNTALIEYLRTHGVHFGPASAGYLSNKVIFMNPRLAVPDAAIANHPDVLLPHRLNAYLNAERRAGLGERLLGSVVRWCLDSESAAAVVGGPPPIPDATLAAIRTAIDALPTWDALRYFGGRTETGDLLHVTAEGVVIPRNQIGGRFGCRVRWTRNRAWGLAKAVTGVGRIGWLHLPSGWRPITASDVALFHRAGEPAPAQLPLVALDGITLG